jgi:tetratricopeptide (TPR) repeat protein
MSQTKPPTSGRNDALIATLVALATFAVYALGACRTIYVGDSGELVAAAATLGIPHPSGYPLYVLLGKLWTLLVPISSIAFRMSLFSAFWGATTCALLYVLGRRLTLQPVAALTASLLLAFSPSFWSQANIQRVYTLNAFFVVALAAAAFEWHRTRRIRFMVLAAFVAGLGAANHTVIGVLGLAVGLFAVISEPSLLRRPRHLAACVSSGVLGLFPYAYLPWRSRHDPRLDWGNPETLDAFLDTILRRDFWGRAWLESPSDLLVIAADYAESLGWELFWGGTALALLGTVVGVRRRWPVLLPLLAMAANFLVVGLHGSRSDIFIWHRYYIPSYVMAAILAGYGVQVLAERWGRRAAVALLIPLVLLVVGYPRFDRSEFRIAEDFSRTLLETLPPGAHLSASDDNILFVLIYLHLVEGVRPDIDLIMQGVGDADLPALHFNPDQDPLFFTHHPNWGFQGIDMVPVGLLFQTVRSGQPWPEPAVLKLRLDGGDDPAVPKDYLTRNLVGHFHYMQGITYERRDWPRAQAKFQRATEIASENDVLFYNLGLIYRRNGLARRALTAFERSAAINPRHIASNRPVRPAQRVAEARQDVERLEALEERLVALAGFDVQSLQGGGADHHLRLAELLEEHGEPLAGRGHRLLAAETVAAGGS